MVYAKRKISEFVPNQRVVWQIGRLGRLASSGCLLAPVRLIGG